MERAKSAVKSKRKIWRISEAAPLGEFVDPTLPVPRQTPAGAPENLASQAGDQGWTMSSSEFLDGVEVSEEDPSTVPAELIDELFKRPKT